MATNVYASPGDTIDLVAPTGGTASGGVIVAVTGSTGICGVAVDAIAAAASGPCYIKNRVVTLAAITSGAFTNLQLLYWDSSAAKLTTVASGNNRIGRAWGAKGSATATAQVLLGQF